MALSPGQQVADLIFRLQRLGAITGRVTDEDGDPVEGVMVEALVRRRVRGKDSISDSRHAKTNDLGEYRLYDLSAGHYYVRATFERGSASIIGKSAWGVRLSNPPADTYQPITPGECTGRACEI